MSEPTGTYHTHPTPKIDVLLELLESFTLEQLQFMANKAKEQPYGYIVVGMKKNPDVMLLIPSLKLPRE